jgi:hypothetical protein
MSKFWKRLLSLVFALIVLAGLLGLVFVVPVLTTEIDPNLMRPQCPGGKDWDLPGSSCHDGMIVDYILTIDETTAKKLVAEKKKRDR